jgi:hypothetical protein
MMTPAFPIFILSGGVGMSGEQIVRTVLAQFPDANVTIQVFPKITQEKQVEELFRHATQVGALIVHTFVDPQLRATAEKYAKQGKLAVIDLFNPLMDYLTEQLGEQPQGTPGLYRQLHRSYFERIDAIKFSLDHDDGKRPDGWQEAEIIRVHFISVGGSPKKREGWGMYIPHPSLFFGRFNSFETHPNHSCRCVAGGQNPAQHVPLHSGVESRQRAADPGHSHAPEIVGSGCAPGCRLDH